MQNQDNKTTRPEDDSRPLLACGDRKSFEKFLREMNSADLIPCIMDVACDDCGGGCIVMTEDTKAMVRNRTHRLICLRCLAKRVSPGGVNAAN